MNSLHLIELAPDLLYICKFDGQFMFANPAFKKILGYSVDEILSINAFSIVHTDDLQSINDLITSKGKDNDNSLNFEYRIRCKDGTYKWIQSNVKIVRGERLIYAAGRDITLRKNMEFNLIKAREKADEANKAKDLFLANMSHEFRTPMNGVTGMLYLLGLSNLTKEQKQYVSIAKKSSDTLLGIIDNILDLSKIEADKVEFKYVKFDLSRAVKKVITAFDVRANEKGLEFIDDVDYGLLHDVIGDPDRFSQVLNNLISNAIKFTQKGKIIIAGSIIKEEEKKIWIKVSVIDTGIGIPTERKDFIFGNFTQVNSSYIKEYTGTGIGLAITKIIIESMGGTIAVDSEVGRGSTFSIILSFTKIGGKVD